MGGAILTITGQSEKEVEKKLEAKKREALHMGMYEEIRSPVEYDPDKQQYRALLKVHS